MNKNNKRQEDSFQNHFEFINKSNKNYQKRNSNGPSRFTNYLGLNTNNSELKRASTNELEIMSELENSKISSNLFNKKKKFSNRKSLKFIEKNIKNRILDISLQIEKEDNMRSVILKDNNNLNLSTFIKKQIEGENIHSSTPPNRIFTSRKLKSKNRENKIMKFDLNESNSKQNLMQSNINNSISRIMKNNNKNEKFRVLIQKNILYDSFDSEEERENEAPSFHISPKSKFVLIFDFLIIIFCLLDIIFTPYNLSKRNGFCEKSKNFMNYIYYYIDILYIIDLILGFLRSYYNFQFIVIKYQPRIIRHYLVTQFWFDFFEAIPSFSYISFLCKNKYYINCQAYDLNNRQFFLLLFCFVKQIKLFKIIDLKKNSIMFNINENLTENETVENIINLFITTGICIFCFYLFISIHIFIGRHSYPNWISRNGFQNQSNFLLYLTSFYYLITTMTTVGYGDIVVASFSEVIFQIIILSVGIIVYSWIVSNIGNYVKNESYASMRFNKDGTILEEIRISHPNMPFKLYKQILQHLNARKIRQQQCDSNILINSLPYSLKNSVLLAIYKQTINNLKIFKNCKNSDFILRLLNNFIPLFSKKNAILIHEGQLIENIIFVKNGRLSLQAAIDFDEPEESMKHYLDKNFGDISDDLMLLSKYESSNTSSSIFEPKTMQKTADIAKTVFETIAISKTKSALTSEINESRLEKEIGKWEYGGDDFEESNYQFLNIINISKNESYGVVYMFLTKPSPLSLRVKSKKVELLLLRKAEALDISQRYPNIWMKFLKKSYFNLLSIKNIAINKIKHYIENFEKKSNKKKPILKSKTNLNPYTIYRLKSSEAEDLAKIAANYSDKNLKMIKSRTLGKKKLPIIKGNSPVSKIININNKKNKSSFTFSTNLTEKKDLNLNKEKEKEQTNINKIEDNFQSIFSSNRIDDNKTSLNQSSFEGINTKLIKRNYRYSRKALLNKMKAKIRKLKNSKTYYKKLCHTLTSSKNLSNLNLNSNLLGFQKTSKNNNDSPYSLARTLNQNVNIFHSINPNIINNITIKNNNEFLYKSANIESPNNSESFYIGKNTEKRERQNKFEKIEIKSEINIFYKAKYINLENYTEGAFSTNEELRKQSLNFIKVFLEIEKKKKKKLQKSNSRSIQSNKSNKMKNPYINNYDFRYIFNKLNENRQKRRSSIFSTPKTIIMKKENVSNTYLLSSHVENKLNNTSIIKIKNNYSKKCSKRTLSKKAKKRSPKIKNSINETLFSPNKKGSKSIVNLKEKIDNSMIEQKDKDKKNTGFFKLPIKNKTIDEWENENIVNNPINENEFSNHMDSDIHKNESRLNTIDNGISILYSQKSHKSKTFKFESSNELS